MSGLNDDGGQYQGTKRGAATDIWAVKVDPNDRSVVAVGHTNGYLPGLAALNDEAISGTDNTQDIIVLRLNRTDGTSIEDWQGGSAHHDYVVDMDLMPDGTALILGRTKHVMPGYDYSTATHHAPPANRQPPTANRRPALLVNRRYYPH